MNYLHNLTLLFNYLRSGGWRFATKRLQPILVWINPLTIVATVALGVAIAGCAQPSAPSAPESAQAESVQLANSQAAADLTASAMGTESGGSGMVFADALHLAHGEPIPDAILRHHFGNDSANVHIVTVTRTKTRNGFGYSGTWTHTWVFFDAAGDTMPRFIKGQTDKIVMTSSGQHTTNTPRVSTDDSSSGAWVISGLVTRPDSAILNGTLTRAGQTTHLKDGKTMTHSFTINFANDTLIRTVDKEDMDDTVAYLLGSASSDFKATNFNGVSFERQIAIVFHGDGTATLTITRTSSNGQTDTHTVDVKRGLWLHEGKH